MLMGSNEGNFLHGGAADDTIYVINTGDRISGGGGIDTAYATVDFALPTDVENLTMDARWSPVTGTGNAGDNILTAVNAGVTLQGGGGNDVFVSAGGDTFVFAPGSGDSTIYNFAKNSDVIRLSDYGFSTFGQVKGAMTQEGADTLLKLSSTDSILFKGVGPSGFSANDFQLSVNTHNMATTFDDEFNGLNLKQEGAANGWNTSYDWADYSTESAHTITGESEIYVDPTFSGTGSSALGLNPFSINNGVLSITPAKTSAAAQASLWGHDYTSGLLTTQGTFAQTYGYFEMKAQLPAGQGSFPAFWLLSADGKYNEIDVMETVNGDDQVWNHIHYTPDGASSQTSAGFSTTVPNLSSGEHTFGLLWSPQTITWYVDGTAVASTATPAALNSPMYMLVDYAVGGSWAGGPDGSNLSPMKVDYVRAYSLDDAPVSQTDGGDVSTADPGTSTPSAPASTSTAVSTPTDTASQTGGATYALAPSGGQTIGHFDPAHDVLALPTGTNGFHLAGAGQASPTMVDASAWWNGIDNAQVVRWTGSATSMNSAAKVDAVLQSMPGNNGGGVMVVGYTADHHVGIYYDSDPAHAGGARLVATLADVTDTGAVTGADFQFGGGSTTTTTTVAQSTSAQPAVDQSATTAVQSGGSALAGTSGADVFMLAKGTSETITGYDAGHDGLGLHTGTGGFKLADYAGQSSLTGVDASAWWNSIDGAQVVRWTGSATAMDSAAKVDAVLQSMPGNDGGGVMVVAYTADHHVGIYYDSNPAHAGGASLVATLAGVTDPTAVSAGDFHLFS